jgi:hypothetical protein
MVKYLESYSHVVDPLKNTGDFPYLAHRIAAQPALRPHQFALIKAGIREIFVGRGRVIL